VTGPAGDDRDQKTTYTTPRTPSDPDRDEPPRFMLLQRVAR
jgi:hypothetical protein